jgi:hypothetical protein
MPDGVGIPTGQNGTTTGIKGKGMPTPAFQSIGNSIDSSVISGYNKRCQFSSCLLKYIHTTKILKKI